MNTTKSSYRSALLISTIGALAAAPVAVSAALDIPMVEIGGAGNASDRAYYAGSAYGKVDYNYNIGTTEVTNAQYAVFLNSVGKTDNVGLYNTNMGGAQGGIQRSGTNGSYVYTVIEGKANNPVNYVSFFDAARFSNWLTNGATNSSSTEVGMYNITPDSMFARNEDAWNAGGYAIASADEWYKAAYYNVEGGYYTLYATGETVDPTKANYKNSVGNPMPVGSYASEQNGTYDMMGNVDEWTDSVRWETREIRGGSLVDPGYGLAASNRYVGDPGIEAYNLGFRLSQAAFVPEPSTYATAFTIVIFGATLVCRRRRGIGWR